MAMKPTVTIKTCLKNGLTTLQDMYFTQPFKVADITEDKRNGELHLMLMSSSPGILDGDEYKINIEVGESCNLRLYTQSYQRLFNMQAGAKQTMDVRLAKNSTFCYLPHPSVPHEASKFTAKNTVNLSEGCTLLWGEVLTSGRQLRNEVFCFSHFHSCTEIYLGNRLILKENLRIEPSNIDVYAMGQLEGYTHQAGLFFLKEGAGVNKLLKQVGDWLLTQKEVEFGVTEAPVPGVVVRLLGYKAEQLFSCLKKVQQILIDGLKEEISQTKMVHFE
jgi:urease accessory protein